MKLNLSRKAEFRLLKLAEHLKSLPPAAAKHFNMEHWLRHTSEDGHQHAIPGKVLQATDLLECGTTACALGWASSSPYFRRLGLRLVARDSAFAGVRLGRKTRTAHDVFEFVQELFDVDLDTAFFFFRDMKARSPKEWAEKVEKKLA